MGIALLVVLAYLIGSIPTAVWMSKGMFGIDIREHGSGNAGATNTFRVLGAKAGTIVMIGDMLKGYIAVQLSVFCIYNFGLNLGIAFQLQDDYLDAFGDPETFGKQVGGDIIENKKTYLYLKALEHGSAEDKELLLEYFEVQPEESATKIAAVKQLFTATGADTATKNAIEAYTLKAFATLEEMDIEPEKKEVLRKFGENLMQRIV